MLVKTHEITQVSDVPFSRQVYNGLDCMVTLEVFEALQKLGNTTPFAYDFSRALQGPVLEIMLRGFRVNRTAIYAARQEVERKVADLNEKLQTMAVAVWGRALNPRSNVQLCDFFYKHMRLPEQWTRKKGERKLSMDREALEKLEIHLFARPIIACILSMRALYKQLDVLTTPLSADGRMRTSYNIAGTETGRFSSSAASDESGGNLQNIEQNLRRIFVADEGMILVVIDLEQAESREVGLLCGLLFDDWTYLDACEGGDLHTSTARLIWPRLGWTGDMKHDRAIAELPFYRHFSYRDMSKRGGHGTTYYGTPWTMSRHLKVPLKLMEDFQSSFFGAYPAISKWHKWVAEQLQTRSEISTPWGFQRTFFGRATDPATLREAIAFSPQSSTAYRTNLGLYRIWKELGNEVQLLAQTHDSVTFQCPVAAVDAMVPRALACMEIPMTTPHGRVVTVPGDPKVGFNWANAHRPDKPTGPRNPHNPDGLRKWKPGLSWQRTPLLDQAIF